MIFKKLVLGSLFLCSICSFGQDVNKEGDSTDYVTKPMQVLKDKNVFYSFTITLLDKKPDNNEVVTIDAFPIGMYLQFGESLQNIFSTLLETDATKIIIKESLKSNLYNVSYKNKNLEFKNELSKDLIANICKSLGLKESTTKRNIECYYIKLKDFKKLKKAKDTIATTSGFGTHGDDVVTDVNSKGGNIKEFSKVITKHLKITTEDHTGIDDKQKFDFEIEAKNVQELEVALKKYGLYLEKTTKEVEFYSYE